MPGVTSGRALRPPFNEEKRADAGLPPDFYWPLAADNRAVARNNDSKKN